MLAEPVGLIDWTLSESGASSSVQTNRRGERAIDADGGETLVIGDDPQVHTVRVFCGGCRKVPAGGTMSVEGFRAGFVLDLPDLTHGRT